MNDADFRRAMTAMPLLEGVSAELLDEVLDATFPVALARGDSAVTHLEDGRDVYFIVSGEMRVALVSPSGRPLTYQVLGAGDMFGEVAAIDHLPRSASVTADTEAMLGRMPGPRFLGLIESSTEFALLVLKRMAQLNRRLSVRLLEYHAYDVKARVCAELLRLGEARSWDTFSITDGDMASRVGTTRENVSRIHGELRKLKLIERNRSQTRVLQPEMVDAFIEGHEFS